MNFQNEWRLINIVLEHQEQIQIHIHRVTHRFIVIFFNSFLQESRLLPTLQPNKIYFSFTFPSPGVSLILLAARRRQGGAGGGTVNRAALKLVGNRGGSHDGDDDVTGAVTAAVFCFFFLDAKFNFCAALTEEKRKTRSHPSIK